MHVLAVVHHSYAGLGVFQRVLADGGHELTEWVPEAGPPPAADGFDALIVLGGQARAGDEAAHPWLRDEKRVVAAALSAETPVLGVCLGAQVLATVAGGGTRPAARPEIGWSEIELTPEGVADPVVGGLPRRFEAFEWHHDEFVPPPGADVLARSDGALQAFRLRGRPVWGVQFHPEATGPDLGTWLDGWKHDPGAVASGLDPAAIRRETAAKIAASNELGRGLVARFLARAAGT